MRNDSPSVSLSLMLMDDDEASVARREAETLAEEITQQIMARLASVLHLLPPPETD